MRSMEKRVAALEGGHMAQGVACVLKRSGETEDEALARWTAEKGPLDGRMPFFVNLVDASI